MSNWKCLFISSILLLALFPLSVQGTSENDTSLEAREIDAVYNENEIRQSHGETSTQTCTLY